MFFSNQGGIAVSTIVDFKLIQDILPLAAIEVTCKNTKHNEASKLFTE